MLASSDPPSFLLYVFGVRSFTDTYLSDSASRRRTVFSREQMLETVWKYDYAGDARTVDVHIRRLREKIERDTSKPEFIFTKWGVGYYFTDQD